MDDVFAIKPSTRYVLFRLLLTLFLVETLYALAFIVFLLARTNGDYDRSFIIFLWVVHTVKFFVLAALFADIIIRFLDTRYYVARHHLIISRGLVTNEEKVYELKLLKRLSYSQDTLGKQFNYGSVRMVLGARGYEEELLLKNIADPHGITKKFEAYLEAKN